MAREYTVTWVIDLDADSPEDAARKALDVQRDPESIATCFDVAIRVSRPAVSHVDIHALDNNHSPRLGDQRGSIAFPLLAFQLAVAIGLGSGVLSILEWAQGVLGGVL